MTQELALGGQSEERSPIRVLLVDDHALVRQGISSLRGDDGSIVVAGEAWSLAGGLALAASVAADVLVVDVSLGDGSGLDLVREMRRGRPAMGIVVLTMHDDDDTLLEALDAGASALVLKSGTADEVVSTVRRAAVAPDAFTAVGLAGALRRRSSASTPTLTVRELEVLQRLAAGDSVTQAARQLYMSESTVKTHIGKIYDKLGVHNRASAVMSAIRLGLVTSE
ncbi:MAG: response regulator [Lapillicoccus sp.]